MRDLLPLRLEKLEATLAAAVSLREATSSQPATATLLRVTSAPLFTIYSMLYAASASVWRGWAVRAALLAQPPRETSGRAHHHANSVEPHEKEIERGIFSIMITLRLPARACLARVQCSCTQRTMPAVSVAVAGDVHGRFGRLYERVAAEAERSGHAFACVLCVGEFFPREDEDGAADDVDVADYLSGRVKAPLPTYFLGGSDFNGLTWLKAIGAGGVFCDNMQFLGSAGLCELHGLSVAFVSDAPDAAAADKALGVLAEAASKASFSGADILLTNSWSEAIASAEHLGGEAAASAPLRKPCKLAGCAAAMMRPRYHFAAGEGQSWERAAYENASVPHVGRFIALAPLNEGSAPHALTASTLSSLPPAELWARPERLTPCPYDTAAMRDSFPAALRSKYAALIAEVCPSAAGRASGKPAPAARKPIERRAAAVVGYSDDSESDSDGSDGDDDDDDDSDSDSDSGAEEAKRAAKRRKASAANPLPASTAPTRGGKSSSALGSVEDLFATTARSAVLTRKEDAFEVGEWDAKQAEAKLQETMASASEKARLDFINEGEKNSLTKGASSRLGRGAVGNNSKPGCVTGSNFGDYH